MIRTLFLRIDTKCPSLVHHLLDLRGQTQGRKSITCVLLIIADQHGDQASLPLSASRGEPARVKNFPQLLDGHRAVVNGVDIATNLGPCRVAC